MPSVAWKVLWEFYFKRGRRWKLLVGFWWITDISESGLVLEKSHSLAALKSMVGTLTFKPVAVASDSLWNFLLWTPWYHIVWYHKYIISDCIILYHTLLYHIVWYREYIRSDHIYIALYYTVSYCILPYFYRIVLYCIRSYYIGSYHIILDRNICLLYRITLYCIISLVSYFFECTHVHTDTPKNILTQASTVGLHIFFDCPQKTEFWLFFCWPDLIQ